MHVSAFGLGTASVQTLDLQVVPDVVHPQNAPDPLVVKIQVEYVLILYDVQAV